MHHELPKIPASTQDHPAHRGINLLRLVVRRVAVLEGQVVRDRRLLPLVLRDLAAPLDLLDLDVLLQAIPRGFSSASSSSWCIPQYCRYFVVHVQLFLVVRIGLLSVRLLLQALLAEASCISHQRAGGSAGFALRSPAPPTKSRGPLHRYQRREIDWRFGV